MPNIYNSFESASVGLSVMSDFHYFSIIIFPIFIFSLIITKDNFFFLICIYFLVLAVVLGLSSCGVD